ncbi:MAG: hypothetical protein WCO66_03510 [Candidatus Absconditabacteria bacterium]
MEQLDFTWLVRIVTNKLRLIISTVIILVIFSLLYEWNVLDFFFRDPNRHPLRGILILSIIPGIVDYLIYKLYDSFVVYKEVIPGTVTKRHKYPIYSDNSGMEQQYAQAIIQQEPSAYTYFLSIQRNNDEESFDIMVSKDVYESIKEGDTIQILKTRTMAEAHYQLA